MKRAIVALVLLVASCSSSATSEADLTLTEFRISAAESTLNDGSVILDVANSGEFGHTVVVADSVGQVVGASSLIQPGETAKLELDLDPGQYEFTCRIVFQDDDGNIIDHYEAGMHTRIDVRD